MHATVSPIVRHSSLAEIYVSLSCNCIYAQNDADEDLDPAPTKHLTAADIAKIHRQLGHATVAFLRRLLQASSYSFSNQDVYDAVRLFGCGREDDAVQRPAVSRHLPSAAGETISMDICYPWNRDRGYHCVILIDLLTRFVAAKFLRGVDQESIIGEFLSGWVQWIGFPKKILVDAGSVFAGSMFSDLSNAYGCVVIDSPVGASYQTGKVERSIQSTEKSFQAIRDFNLSDLDHHSKLALSVLAHNITPCSGATICPVAALTGRTEFLDELSQTPLIKTDHRLQTGSYRFFDRMQAVKFAQAAITQHDPSRAVQTCIRRNLQAGSSEAPQADDLVDIWIPQKHRWRGTYRVIQDTGRNVVLGNQGKLTKHPKAWTRLRDRQETTSVPVPASPSTDPIVTAAVPDNMNVQTDLASPAPLNAVIIFPANANDSSHGQAALDLIRMQSRDSTAVDSLPAVVPFDHEDLEDVSFLQSIPLLCGFSSDRLQFPVYFSSIFFLDADWTWDWILQSECLGRSIPSESSFPMYSSHSPFVDWSTRGAFALSNDETQCNPNECMSLEGEFRVSIYQDCPPKRF